MTQRDHHDTISTSIVYTFIIGVLFILTISEDYNFFFFLDNNIITAWQGNFEEDEIVYVEVFIFH